MASTTTATTTTTTTVTTTTKSKDESLELPQRFLNAENGDKEKGMTRYKLTMEWRKENGVDNMLSKPHLHFDLIKAHTVQYYHKRTKEGHPIYIEIPKRTEVEKLSKEGVDIPHMCFHYTFISEFLWKIFEPNDMSKCFSIVDCADVGLSDFGGDVQTYMKAINEISGMHYPERCFRIFVVNAPWIFSAIWKILKGFIDPVTAAKVQIFNNIKSAKKDLLKHIDAENLPAYYGGTCKCNPEFKDGTDKEIHNGCCYFSPEEVQLREIVQKLNEEHNANPGSEKLKDTIVMTENPS